MTKEDAIEYAIKELPNILPLDTEQIKDLCEQTIKEGNNPEQIAQSFFDLLGQDDSSVHFIFEFNERLMELPRKTAVKKPIVNETTNTKKVISPLINTVKTNDSRAEFANKSIQATKPILNRELKKVPTAKAVKKDSGKESKEVRLDSLKDIDDVLKMLEMRSVSGDSGQYKCNCQGTRHPIFDPAPNCLSCGKIICVKEGLHMNNCSFCGAELIPAKEREQILELLRLEREQIELQKVEENKPKPKQTKKYKIKSGAGTNLWQEQEKMLQRVEKDREQEREIKRQQILNGESKEEEEDEQLIEARNRLDKLLHFQDTSAERTKIIDNASDFAMNEDVMWGSAYERALQLKKQQRNLRKWEKIENERNGRREKVVLDLTIGKDGKVVMTEAVRKSSKKTNATSDDEIDDISDEEDLQDLEDIKNLKLEINQQKQKESSKLTNNVWDYNKAQSEFKKPVYIANAEEEKESAPKKVSNEVHRVQVGIDDRPSLQDSILAIL
ncbi:Rqt4p [Kluyveromyces lactis]|uniref:KLLA0F13882p n=1 Tax=Kluyveromyces lactis (strain ATCC 8585 / CBS 2359 / DSM 70799 / NBRC 1267 / NRRL Y-1140 / WM37) TaxID=284590 RepID=Q6CK34_KLULA|nr:uncharacterized protein KLLA0_F13882g [Kluyveromyces lactis]CAG98413.1 KLLA0F13882p [Kluyveromyces lactis]|eukprot:XP_455705.1 uncharacterized protein KLLA0_F13882g [Kluyveromyces lactis]